MGLRSVGLLLPNAAGVLAIAGALYDRFVPSVPANHLAYLGADASGLDPRYAELDLAMLRSIGGCLMAVGVTALVLANGPVRRGEGWRGRPSRCWSGWPRGTTPTGCTRSPPPGAVRSGAPCWLSPGPSWQAHRGCRLSRGLATVRPILTKPLGPLLAGLVSRRWLNELGMISRAFAVRQRSATAHADRFVG